jgi:hypothetical protein
MKRVAGLVMAFTILSCATTNGEDKIEPLYPLTVGSVWTYRLIESKGAKPDKEKTKGRVDKEKSEFKSKDDYKSKDDFKSKDEPKDHDESTGKEESKPKDEPKSKEATNEQLTLQIKVQKKVKVGKDEGFELVTLSNGKQTSSEVVAVKADGVYRESLKDSSMKELKPDVPLKFLALPATSGAKWSVKSVFDKDSYLSVTGDFVIKEEDVTVGTVKYPMATLVESKSLKVSETDSSMKTWFVKDIGIVKTVYKFGGYEATLELEKFEKK